MSGERCRKLNDTLIEMSQVDNAKEKIESKIGELVAKRREVDAEIEDMRILVELIDGVTMIKNGIALHVQSVGDGTAIDPVVTKLTNRRARVMRVGRVGKGPLWTTDIYKGDSRIEGVGPFELRSKAFSAGVGWVTNGTK